MTIGISEQIECVEREIRQRERVYARLVSTGKMTPNKARRETAAMEAVLETLRKVESGERLI